jgi:peptidyl-prolyl cis-trans isomerase A (cyclophilin A)
MMIRRFAVTLLCALVALACPAAMAAPAHAVHKAAPAPAPIPLADTVRVALVTTLGTIVVDLDGRHAPITAANFLHYVDTRRFDGTTFYRAMKLAWGDQPNGLIQGGQREVRRLFPPIAHEPTTQTGLTHRVGALSMARNAPGTAAAMFTIMVGNIPELDADPKATDPDLKAGYAVFGQVVSGMDVVRAIFAQPVSPTEGEGAMRGQMLADPVKLLTARRVPLSG